MAFAVLFPRAEALPGKPLEAASCRPPVGGKTPAGALLPELPWIVPPGGKIPPVAWGTPGEPEIDAPLEGALLSRTLWIGRVEGIGKTLEGADGWLLRPVGNTRAPFEGELFGDALKVPPPKRRGELGIIGKPLDVEDELDDDDDDDDEVDEIADELEPPDGWAETPVGNKARLVSGRRSSQHVDLHPIPRIS